MNLNFYIIYSIDVPFNISEQWDEYEDMTTRELMDCMKENNIELPFDEYEEDGSEDENLDEYEFSFAEYKETNGFYEEYYSEFREEMIEILVNNNYDNDEYNEILNNNLPKYIKDNLDKFYCTELDNRSEEYSDCDLTTIHRKYVAQLNNEDFINFYEDVIMHYSTCNTMGSLTEIGLLPAFSIEFVDNDCIEDCYISILFDKELEEDTMQDIEDKIRELIESGNLTLDYLNNL